MLKCVHFSFYFTTFLDYVANCKVEDALNVLQIIIVREYIENFFFMIKYTATLRKHTVCSFIFNLFNFEF